MNGMLVESLKPKNCFMPGKPLDKIMLAEVRAAIRQTEAIPEGSTTTNGDSLHKAATFIMSASTADAGKKNMKEIILTLS